MPTVIRRGPYRVYSVAAVTFGKFGYNLARLRYEIVFASEAAEDMRRLSADRRSRAKRAIETHLRHEPKKTSRSRIKRLQGISQPQFRLRVDDLRVYYDVEAGLVTILAIVAKSESADWLGRLGGSE